MTQQAGNYHVTSPVLGEFVDEARRIIAQEPEREETVRKLRPGFARLLSDKSWLPEAFTVADPSGGMGQGLGNYLIYRSAERDLALMSLVIPPGATTPVHDHLAWGLVGLYRGEQSERIFRRLDTGTESESEEAQLAEVEQRRLKAGDFYDLLPPEGDIHSVTTLGATPSVSIHLLGSDIGCVWRHRFEPEHNRAFPFRSGYSNEECRED